MRPDRQDAGAGDWTSWGSSTRSRCNSSPSPLYSAAEYPTLAGAGRSHPSPLYSEPDRPFGAPGVSPGGAAERSPRRQPSGHERHPLPLPSYPSQPRRGEESWNADPAKRCPGSGGYLRPAGAEGKKRKRGEGEAPAPAPALRARVTDHPPPRRSAGPTFAAAPPTSSAATRSIGCRGSRREDQERTDRERS